MSSERLMEEAEECEVLKHLTEFGYLEGTPAHGIALQVIKQGRESLRGDQTRVFEHYIVERFLNVECSRCGEPLPMSEIAFALEEGDGFCTWCRKMSENDD